ncbi:DUF4365 domain-containing protein [Phosphitispora fastidiosa]|uniref:DUF4365 domain-containing protein n=1 Tax=Phosphitispora fastidiosa TaxID=2837202 RepID=UPI001E615C5F|nr:DUF4365 domain-containing protein [Phosphitispora fastidiosa]MBU7008884.1 hypothetical protein [Phosphitispora fastidiosa]
MAQRTKTHEIDTIAQQVFCSSMPESWVIRKQEPDYGIDFQVEVFENGQSTGVLFEVQLKGTTLPNYKNGYLLHRFKVSHLLDYIGRVLPIIIVIVDAKMKRAFWVSVDETISYLWKTLPDWGKRKYLTLCVPVSQELPETTTQLGRMMTKATSSLRSLKRDTGCLVFSYDDYCFVPDGGFNRLENYRLEIDVNFYSERPMSEIIVSFCIEEGSGASRFQRSKGLLEVWKLCVDQKIFLGVVNRAVDPRQVFIGPPITIKTWQELNISVSSDSLILDVNGTQKHYELESKLPIGHLFIIGAKSTGTGIVNGLYGAIKKIKIHDLNICRDIALWTFPRIFPSLDISGNGRYLSFPFTETSRNARCTNDPYYTQLFD